VLLGPGPASAQTTWTPSSARPYSDPVWFPLRATAKISCTYRNCPGPYHPYWALDFLGQQGDPVYAAGAGIVHIGAIDSSCKTSASPDAPGTWLWIDHGGGVVSRYHHLDSVTVHEGQLVTPATQIGRMGHSGDYAPCQTNYLHFEVRHGGVKGARAPIGGLIGCRGTARTAYPSALGYASWSDVPKAKVSTPALGNGCLPSSTATSTAPAAVGAVRGAASAHLSWRAPASGASTVTSYLLSAEMYAPSVGSWHAPAYRSVSAAQRSAVVANLTNGRRYRFRVLARNAVGDSAWTRYVEVVPAARPSTPATTRGLTAGTTTVRLYWWKATEHGTPVTSYTVAIRRRLATRWSAWGYASVPAHTYSHKFTDLRRGRTYQVTVRANSSAGSTRFGVVRTTTTHRS
jgi:hypothetical protein